jgi:hypothetical protein
MRLLCTCTERVPDSVVDQQRFDADPDPNFHVDAVPDSDRYPDWQQHVANPHADPTPSFTHVWKILILFLLLVTAFSISNDLSPQCQ